MGAKSESGWLSGSHCRVLCNWSSISVMCGWMDLNSPTIFSFASHALLCLNLPPKSHWRSLSALGIKRELLPSMCPPIIDLVAGTSLVVAEVHSLGPGRCTCKIETTARCCYLCAGRRGVPLPLGTTCRCWDHAGFGFISVLSSLTGQAQARVVFAAADLRALTYPSQLTQLTRAAMGRHFLHLFYGEAEEWSCVGCHPWAVGIYPMDKICSLQTLTPEYPPQYLPSVVC